MLPFSYAVRNLIRDPWKLFQKVLGSALVVFLIFAAGTFNEGMKALLQASGNPENVILVSAGSEESVERSEVMIQSEEQIAAGVRGIATRMDQLAVSGEVHYMGNVIAGSILTKALLRGVAPSAFEVHREVRLLEGRYPASGEVIVGRLAWNTLGVSEDELAVGRSVVFEGQEFRIAGLFEAPGTVMESEIWLDRTDLMTLVQRDTLSCVVIRLASADDYPEVDLFSKQRLDLELVAIRESDYYGKMAEFYGPIRGMTWLTAGLVAAGAVFGGLNMLYAAFSSRIRELATLQSIGFSRGAILVCLMQESLLSTLLGTLVAAYAAVLLLEGMMVPFSFGSFHLVIGGGIAFGGLATGVLLGTIGALPPAIRCLGSPLPVALRSQ
ncbi:MAG: ABC transporter permease [Verrucomicrobiota bacterium]